MYVGKMRQDMVTKSEISGETKLLIKTVLINMCRSKVKCVCKLLVLGYIIKGKLITVARSKVIE